MTLPVIIELDEIYTAQKNQQIANPFSSEVARTATHVSDVLYCLRKAWYKKRIERGEIMDFALEAEDTDPILTWVGGLQFEALISEGDKQHAMAFCFTCRTVVDFPPPENNREVENCPICNQRWMVGTPDYKIDGKIYEVKQTRKSQRRGPQDAPWWAEQLGTYIFMDNIVTGENATEGGFVVNWLMGDYGSNKKGEKGRPPRSTLEAFKVTFPDDWSFWEKELLRRKVLIEGDDLPPLAGLDPGGYIDSPRYLWECGTCTVGKLMACERYIWDDEGKVIEDVAV